MSATRLVRGRIGEVVERQDGVPKVSGEFAYSSDLDVPGMLVSESDILDGIALELLRR